MCKSYRRSRSTAFANEKIYRARFSASLWPARRAQVGRVGYFHCGAGLAVRARAPGVRTSARRLDFTQPGFFVIRSGAKAVLGGRGSLAADKAGLPATALGMGLARSAFPGKSAPTGTQCSSCSATERRSTGLRASSHSPLHVGGPRSAGSFTLLVEQAFVGARTSGADWSHRKVWSRILHRRSRRPGAWCCSGSMDATVGVPDARLRRAGRR